MIRLSGIRYIYEARLATRAVVVQEAFAVLGIAVGVALLFASQVSSTSLNHAVSQLNAQLVGSAQVQLKARSYQGVPERLLTEVRAAPGVRTALPILERQINVIGQRGERPVLLIGVEPQAMKLSSKFDHRFSAKQLARVSAIALPVPLDNEIGSGPLEPVQVQVGARDTETLVGATLGENEIGGLVMSPIAVTAINYAQALTQAPKVLTRIFVRYDPAQAGRARAALAALAAKWRVNLQPSTFESRLFAVAVAPENKSEQLFSGISALVGFLFALNAMLITVPSRRRLIEDLYPHGSTPAMTIQILLVNALVLGVFACGLGIALGDMLSIAVFHATPGYLTFAFPVGSGRVIDWQTVVLAVAVGMTAAVAGVLWPVREILWGPQESTDEPLGHRRWWAAVVLAVAVVCLAVTTYTLLADTKAAVLGNITLVVALACLLPFVFEGAVRLFGRLSDFMDDIGSGLAVSELDAPPARVRYLAIAGTAALAVFGTVEFGGTEANLIRGLDASIRGMDSGANLWVVPSGGSSLQTTVPFQPVDTGKLVALPGVRSVSAYRGGFLDWGEHRVWVIAPASTIERPVPASEILKGAATSASARVRAGGWAVLSQGLAAEHGLRVGQSFTLPSPRDAKLRLAATTTNLGWPPGAVIMSAADYANGWGSQAPSAYQIQTIPGVSAASERLLVRRALHGLALSVQTTSEREALHYAAARQGLSRLTQIRLLILIAAILAVIAAMTAMIWSRREQIATLKCHGIQEAALWRSLLWESIVILAVGCLTGAIFGLYAQLLGSHFLSVVTGFPIQFNIELVAALTSFALVTLITVAVLAIPGYRVVRVPPSTVSPGH
ncbi:MAG TPA: FtsX-like permease family protein [Solirubrobacteraceae bacterium]|nr:FtsX-like permease family protein [Solirubrobacteraceae bacterium]